MKYLIVGGSEEAVLRQARFVELPGRTKNRRSQKEIERAKRKGLRYVFLALLVMGGAEKNRKV